jgi:prevent-host-death family protein
VAGDRDNPNRKGNVAELKIAAAAAELGIPVLQPMTEHTRYDLVFEVSGTLFRIQCKYAARKGGVICIRMVTNRRGPSGFVRTMYTSAEIDAIAAYCPDTDECYLLPIELIAGRSQMLLRLEPPENGQRAALNWAADHLLSGAVAQLGERRYGIPEATGSSPVSSTSTAESTPSQVVGAHEFRNHFGWYMERASAGESFHVTRRGKPYVRLVPGVERLPIAPSQPPNLTVVADAEDVA